MAFTPLVTDLAGITRAIVDEYESVAITRRLGSYSELAVTLDVREAAAVEFLIAERALKLYEDSDLRFFGQLWEPLEFNEGQVVATARDPYAGFMGRRVRTGKTYTAQDAGAIVSDRVSVQNGYRDTFLNVNVQAASASRTLEYDPGKTEGDIVDELSAMSDGFFYRVDPLDNVPGKMGTLELLYPDAGTVRAAVRFGYGQDTMDNLVGFKVTRTLPLTRLTAASQDAAGGRIAASAENTDASTQYGLFEDETSYTDVTDVTLLESAAAAGVKPTPPLTIELTPAVNSPLLFQDFDVGDFIRLNISWGAVDLSAWVRVTEAVLSVDKQGIPTLTSLTVETLSGARPNVNPERLFRRQLDDGRRRLEALERRVQSMTTTTTAGTTTSAGSGSGSSSSPPTDTTPPPPPPPTPPAPPVITSLTATGQNFIDPTSKKLNRGLGVNLSVDFKGRTGTVVIKAGTASAKLTASGSVFLALPTGTYTVTAVATTSAGSDTASTTATVPRATS